MVMYPAALVERERGAEFFLHTYERRPFPPDSWFSFVKLKLPFRQSVAKRGIGL